MLDSFLKKSSFCANGQFRVFEIALKSGGFPELGGLQKLAGGFFFNILVKGSHTPFSRSTPLFKSPLFLEIQDFPTFYRPMSEKEKYWITLLSNLCMISSLKVS